MSSISTPSVDVPWWQLDGPAAVVADGSRIWVANNQDDNAINGSDFTGLNSVTEINATTGAIIRVASSSSVDPYASAVAADSAGAWLVTNYVGGKWAEPGAAISEFSAATGKLVRTVSEPQLFHNSDGTLAIATSGGRIWVGGADASDDAGWIAEFNAATGTLIRKIAAGVPPTPQNGVTSQ